MFPAFSGTRPGKVSRKDKLFISFANVPSTPMAALMFVGSFHNEKLCGGTQSQDCSRFYVRQNQTGQFLLPPALFSKSVATVSSKKLINKNLSLPEL